MDDIRTAFAGNLKRLTRLYRTDADFSRAVGLQPDRISKLKKPDGTALPTVKELVAISDTCGVTIDSLLRPGVSPEAMAQKEKYTTMDIRTNTLPILYDLDDQTAGEVFKALLHLRNGEEHEDISGIAGLVLSFILADWNGEN